MHYQSCVSLIFNFGIQKKFYTPKEEKTWDFHFWFDMVGFCIYNPAQNL